jgi:ComF family protein
MDENPRARPGEKLTLGAALSDAGSPIRRAWPNRCAVCRNDTQGVGQRLCADCVARFAPHEARCRLCALPLASPLGVCGRCLRDPPPWSRAVAACDYAYPWDGLVAALKFHDALDLSGALAGLLAARLVERGSSEEAAGRPAPSEPVTNGEATAVDALVPMPLSEARLAQRGYNQAALLARALGAALRLPVRDGWLLRIADTTQQATLPRERRMANVLGAFAVEPRALPLLRGRRIALIDDVMTTGATLTEAAREVLAAGAAQVQVWVVARTPD